MKVLDTLTYWKVHFDGYDFRYLVQSCFNSVNQQSKQFKNNMTGLGYLLRDTI